MVNRIRLLIRAVAVIPLALIAANIVLYDSTSVASSTNAQFSSFVIGGKSFKLTYVATNQTELDKGLMDTKVTSTTTELFVFPTHGFYSFWMYGVNTSLDIMWVSTPAGNETGHFVYLALNEPPCHVNVVCETYQPSAEADYVIEARAGFAAANGIAVGTPVTIK